MQIDKIFNLLSVHNGYMEQINDNLEWIAYEIEQIKDIEHLKLNNKEREKNDDR